MEEINCLLCNSSQAQPAIEESGYVGKKCATCPLIYISPRPTADEIIDIYGHSNAHISAQSHITESVFKKLHSRHTLRIIKKYKRSGKILEIGAGGGFFLKEARAAGFDPYAIELNPVQASFIKNNLWICCDQKPFTQQSFGSLKFDIIYHSDVISHFHDPRAIFAAIYEKLNSGGLVIFETGNLADVAPSYYSLFGSFQYPDHLFFFGQSSLKQLLARNNFNVRALYRYSIVLHLKILKLLAGKMRAGGSDHTENQGNLNASFGKRVLKNIYHRFLYAIRYKVGAWLPKNGRPQTIIMVGQKN